MTAEARTRLIGTVIDRKAALVVGAFTSGATAATAAWLTGAWWPYFWFATEAALLGYRLAHLFHAAEASERSRERHVAALMVAGLIWCAVFGLAALACLKSGHTVLAIMAGINIAGAAGAISSRNAAMPRYGGLAILLACAPFAIGALVSPLQEMRVIAFLAPLWMAGMYAILLQNYDVTSRMIRAELSTRRLARTDPLTDLPNRIHLEERLSQLCARPKQGRPPMPFTVLCLDLDGFKAVNDRHGHGAGDALLRAVAGRIAHALRDGDIVCRVGGDEFVVLMPGAAPVDADAAAGRIIASVGRPFDIDLVETVLIGVSVGSAAGSPGDRPAQLLAAADKALYEAKRAGKGVHRAA